MPPPMVASPGFLSFVLMVEFLFLFPYLDLVIIHAQVLNSLTAALLQTILVVTVYNTNVALSQISFLSS